jgi:periplasmic protein TonB
MDNIVSRTANPAARGFRAVNGSIADARKTDSYDCSSLALEFSSTASPAAEHAPKLILKRPAAQMFRGLDQSASHRDRGAGILSLFVHFEVASAILLWGMMMTPNRVVQSTDNTIVPIRFTLYDPPPPPVMPVAKVQGGGGGGGAHQLVSPSKGRPPKVAKIPIVHLEAAKINLPKLQVAPSVQVRLPQDTALPKLGMPQSTQQVALASQGSGSESGFGLGMGGGIGQGRGTGGGPGSDGSYGGGLMNVGGGVSAPRVIHSVEPQFTAEARQADYQGVVGIQLIVDSQGNPQDIRVVRHLGMGLDERAVEAVRQYRFSPAMYQGHAVSVQMIIDVDFRLH